MSYNHTTVGSEAFDAFMKALEVLNVTVEVPAPSRTPDGTLLRKALFTTYTRRRTPRDMVVEEYLSVDDRDCDGISRVAIEVYPRDNRPDLEARCQIIN